MAMEYEVKVLDIDETSIVSRLESLGADPGNRGLMRRWVFVIPGKDDEWIRLRDEGKGSTITFKKKQGQAIDQTVELEVSVSDFETMAEILMKLDFPERYYQENHRTVYTIGDIEFSIDAWPMIPKYIEVEAPTQEGVYRGLEMLGLQGKDVGNLSVVKVYERYGIDLHSFEIVKF